MLSTNETEAIRGALAAGRLAVPDPETGYHHWLWAACPNDGGHAQVRRVARGARGAITEVTLRCPQCGHQFVAGAEALHLH
jgi:hypothetical protein